ncbi:MAG: hypothetical protein PWQ31_503 [Eubacteriales bacterium]|nr:hypothetical protein [Eubacteriales bacterium]
MAQKEKQDKKRKKDGKFHARENYRLTFGEIYVEPVGIKEKEKEEE